MEILVNLIAALIPLAIPSLEMPTPQEYQGNTRVMVRFVDPHEVEKYCGKASQPGWSRIACYWKDELTMPNPCKYPEAKNKDTYAYLLCHEKAHKNGWRH